jgi:hypothetical protein
MCSLTVGFNNTLNETDGGNQEWTIQRQHWSHKTKTNKTRIKLKQSKTQHRKQEQHRPHQNPRVNTAGCSILIRHPHAPCYLHMHSQVQ